MVVLEKLLRVFPAIAIETFKANRWVSHYHHMVRDICEVFIEHGHELCSIHRELMERTEFEFELVVFVPCLVARYKPSNVVAHGACMNANTRSCTVGVGFVGSAVTGRTYGWSIDEVIAARPSFSHSTKPLGVYTIFLNR